MTDSTAHDMLAAGTATGRWVLDPHNSTVMIANKTMWGMVTVKGTFTTLTGSGQVSEDGTINGEIQIDAASIDTHNKRRDQHLRSPDFFDVETHPFITVAIRSATLVSDELHLQAELTAKGIREPKQLTAHVSITTDHTVSLTVVANVDRDHFAMAWNKMGMIKGSATVTISAAFNRET